MAIVVEELKCPKCNAPLDIQPGKPISFCPFCGCALSVRETPDHPTETYNYNYNIKEKKHIVDEASIKWAEARKEHESNVGDAIRSLITWIFMIIMFAGMFFFVAYAKSHGWLD